MQRDLRLAEPRSPREGLETLTDMSDDLWQETRLVAGGARAEDLHQLARLYQKVVEEGIVRRSRIFARRERDCRAVLVPIAQRLAKVGGEAEQLAGNAPATAAAALDGIATAARAADGQLRELVEPRRVRLIPKDGWIACLVLLDGSNDLTVLSDPPPPWQQLTRNRNLIEALVTSGLILAAEEDALRRAEQCTGLARHLVDEIQQAADRDDDDRAAELAGHLHDLLRGGVVRNLNTVRDQTPPTSTRLQALRDAGAEAQRVTDPLEKRFQTHSQTNPGELGRVLQSIHDTRAEMEKILKSSAPSRADP
jgi:hypothetical protein